MVLDTMEHHREALEAYDKAITLQPDNSQVWEKKGILFRKMGKYQAAKEAFAKAEIPSSE